MLDQNTSFTKVLNFICENLPEGWGIEIATEKGYAGCDLVDPEGNTIQQCDDDWTCVEMIVKRVNHARVKDGLPPTEECCEHGIMEGDWCETCNLAYKQAAKENGDG